MHALFVSVVEDGEEARAKVAHVSRRAGGAEGAQRFVDRDGVFDRHFSSRHETDRTLGRRVGSNAFAPRTTPRRSCAVVGERVRMREPMNPRLALFALALLPLTASAAAGATGCSEIP